VLPGGTRLKLLTRGEQAKIAKGDTQGAIKDLETAATLDPQSRPIREQLQRIKGQ